MPMGIQQLLPGRWARRHRRRVLHQPPVATPEGAHPELPADLPNLFIDRDLADQFRSVDVAQLEQFIAQEMGRMSSFDFAFLGSCSSSVKAIFPLLLKWCSF